MYGANVISVLIDEDGQPTPNINNDKVQVLVDKVWSLANEKDRSIFVGYADEGLTNTAFREGRSLILTGGIDNAVGLRDAEIDFAVIPYPKFDEAQEGYYTHVDAWNGILCVGRVFQYRVRHAVHRFFVFFGCCFWADMLCFFGGLIVF
jgi:hypothetical protein